MTAGFMLVTMADVVLASSFKFLVVASGLACLDLFQSMLTKIMFATAVLCSSGPVPCSVAAADVEADPTDDMIVSGKSRQVGHDSKSCNTDYDGGGGGDDDGGGGGDDDGGG